MNGLDLFSGIGGISLALKPWVRTIAYCESDRYAQGVLMSRMRDGTLEPAPIWDDVRTLRSDSLGTKPDIIFGGFPCQDISTAGRGRGVEGGARSGLFFEIVRLVEEVRPAFVFLENVDAIRTRGLSRVLSELTSLRYDCRWTFVSAAEVGAPLDENTRWFLMAAAGGESLDNLLDRRRPKRNQTLGRRILDALDESDRVVAAERDWRSEPSVGRVVDGSPFRVDRFRCLGNAVVPTQAREAFKRLSGTGG